MEGPMRALVCAALLLVGCGGDPGEVVLVDAATERPDAPSPAVDAPVVAPDATPVVPDARAPDAAPLVPDARPPDAATPDAAPVGLLWDQGSWDQRTWQ
jgi:hypothetical protein